MAFKKEELVSSLEDIINRLEQARSDALLIDEPGGVGIRGSDPDVEVTEEIEGAEAALLVAENRIEELTQVMDEEIDNMRRLLEKIEEDVE